MQCTCKNLNCSMSLGWQDCLRVRQPCHREGAQCVTLHPPLLIETSNCTKSCVSVLSNRVCRPQTFTRVLAADIYACAGRRHLRVCWPQTFIRVLAADIYARRLQTFMVTTDSKTVRSVRNLPKPFLLFLLSSFSFVS